MAKVIVTPADVVVFKTLISAETIDVAALRNHFETLGITCVPTESRDYNILNLPLEYKMGHYEVEKEKTARKAAKKKEATVRKSLTQLSALTAASTTRQLGLPDLTNAKVRKELNSIIKKVNKIDALLLAS